MTLAQGPDAAASLPAWRSAFAHDDHKEHLGLAPEPHLAAMDESFGFADLVDILNPLQHLPVVGQIYRAVTGDQIAGPARILGGALYGGPVGLLGGAANAVFAEVNDGQDLGDQMLAQVLGPGSDPVPTEAIAVRTLPPPEPESLPAPATDEAADLASDPRLAGALVDTGSALPTPPQGLPAGLAQGQAALQALARDLGLGAAKDPAPVAAPTAVSDQARPLMPLPERRPPQVKLHPAPAAIPAAPAQALPGGEAALDPSDPAAGAFYAQRMLDALGKYEDLMKARNAEGR